ncbi:queuosine salvage family protein [uncultured Aeromicrobium sp.]|uniref:queuosine salvage family protein n=1 Tax=uncultured Aeromicrobium sp. TaxID=337820 RepID=UPI0025DD9B25|nr:queuosine salvage family protein [uncultured Aeromicrobium sp.]
MNAPDDLSLNAAVSAAWGAPVLGSCAVASGLCRDVTIDLAALARVADWMCHEVFAPIDGETPDDPERPGLATRAEQIDFTMVTVAINFAYTDFETGVPWSIESGGRELVDADGMFARFEQAHAAGVPVLDGHWLAELTVEQLSEVLHGPRRIPMLAERVEVLRGIGARLAEAYDGSFTRFVESCAPAAYADGQGLLERLPVEFPHFADTATFRGLPVAFHKLAQLGVWTLHRLGLVRLSDLDTLAIFPDYIVPAALRAMGVLVYSDRLAALVDSRHLIEAGSEDEVQIRIQSVTACGLLTEALTERRADTLVNPQLDFRLWSAFHDRIQPHHLTITTRY